MIRALPSVIAVEVDALARLDVGIEAFAIAPLRFLAVDDGPSQPPDVVIGVEGREVVAMAAAEFGVFLEQAFLHVEAERLRLVVFVFGGNFARGKLVDIAVAEQNVEQRLAAIIGIGVQDLRRPHLVGGEALRKLHHLPEVGARLAGRIDELSPDMGAALRVAVGAFLFDPHRRGKNEIGGHRGDGRIGIRDDDEVVRIPVAGIGLAGSVRRGLQIVVHLDPVEIQLAVAKHPVLFDGVVAGLLRNDAVRDAPDFLGVLAVLRIGDDHVGRQAMREGADLARGAAGGWLPGQRERRIAGLGDLSGQADADCRGAGWPIRRAHAG